ncbi:putative toxin-antitoxin system toxin component, PIN family [Paraburkholderia sp. Tr-20389]|uniref:putative toxin-antitoxin system toxin component, PIN family n=1 Tax=Paraburkholderia sp. Tr-20389 TaxID=2703903 RepID=UPI001F11BE8D|nr:putative toxin-antitoxin system toxin component, PIN family [Paraburkholderia sp. Tr-20389]MBN3758749.1 putative toxin-antitoxin system toxin component, PIN family [Paraburkholderia sp. Tr-20389]
MPETPALPEQNAPAAALAVAPAVVLDSNVWIDILVFDDPHTRPILAALESGALRALIDARCLAELTHVLDYPQFEKRAVDKAAALATVARLSTLVQPAPADDARPLPKCKDRDDQKFLELAYAMQADWLVSKDRAVLKMARRIARDFGFRIAQPAPFVVECALTAEEAAQA